MPRTPITPLIRVGRPVAVGKAYLAFASGEGDRTGLGVNQASELFITETLDELEDPRWAVSLLRPLGYPHPDRTNHAGMVVGELVKRERLNEKAWYVEVPYISQTQLPAGEWQRRVIFSTRTNKLQMSLAHPDGMWPGDDGEVKVIGDTEWEKVEDTDTSLYTIKGGIQKVKQTGAFTLTGFDAIGGDITFLYRRRLPRLATIRVSQLASYVHTTNSDLFMGIFPKWSMFIGNVAVEDGIGQVGEFVNISDVEVELLWRPAVANTDLAGGWRIFHRREVFKNDKGAAFPVFLNGTDPVYSNFVVQEEKNFDGFFALLGGPPTI